VARADKIARLAIPLTTLQNNDKVFQTLAKLCLENNADIIVVGLPRSLDGQETDQTSYTRSFADALQVENNIKIIFQDEAVTSKQAVAELVSRGKGYVKEDIDALAAAYILEDYLAAYGETLQ
jgi:putative Holliday junction resolvase